MRNAHSRERRAFRHLAALPGHRDAVPGAFRDQPSLEARDRSEDVEDRFAGGG